MREYEVVGKSIPKVDSVPKVKGQAQYIEDLKFPDMLHGKLLRSPYPHAKILHIDVSRAMALRGVRAIITMQDLPQIKFGSIYGGADETALALEKVRHVGEAVAAVAAVDEEMAEEALNLIRVEYEPLPSVFDPLEALRPGAPLIHEDKANNIASKVIKSYGDVEKGFGEADYIREDTFRTVANNHAPLEPHGVVSLWHGDGYLTQWASTQAPFILRRALSKPAGIPEQNIRVIKTIVGGGFGGKVEIFAHNIASAHLSKITGKPVKIILSREEVFLSTRQRHPMFMTVRTGAKKDGTLLSQEFKAIADCGGYTGLGPLMLILGVYMLMIPYVIPNFHYEGLRVYTNLPVGGPLRGHGAPQVRFAVESHLDMLAEEMGKDPLDLRLKNLIYSGYDHPAKIRISSCGLREATEGVAKTLKWREKRGNLPEGQGLGLSCAGLWCGVKNLFHVGGGVVIQVNMDGGVKVLTGAADIGQGIETVVAQMVAEELGVKLENIHVIAADTDITPFDQGTFGSGVTFRVGNAAIAAAREVKKKLMEVVCLKLEAPPKDIEFHGGKVYVQGNREKGMDFSEAVKLYRYDSRPTPIIGQGYYEQDAEVSLLLAEREGNLSPTYAFLCQGVEVSVDKETGGVRILDVVTADDCGRVINPQSVEGQLDGSVSGGLGMALYEDLPQSQGQYTNSNLLDYAIPTSLDMPEKAASILIESVDPLGPFGAKEAGEGILVPVAPTIANAIYNATGARIKELPITSDKIKQALLSLKNPE